MELCENTYNVHEQCRPTVCMSNLIMTLGYDIVCNCNCIDFQVHWDLNMYVTVAGLNF